MNPAFLEALGGILALLHVGADIPRVDPVQRLEVSRLLLTAILRLLGRVTLFKRVLSRFGAIAAQVLECMRS